VSGVRISALAPFFSFRSSSRMLLCMRYHNLHETIEDFFRRYCAAPCTVCVAVSGGSDSVALFHLLCEMRMRLSIARIGVAHVNHRIRLGASDKDAEFVKRLAASAGAAFHLKELDKRDVPSAGKEEWARNERYAFFKEIREKNGYDYVATAHTANDQAETVLLRLMRGTGLNGLCGIAPVREDGVIRPLLHAGKSSLRKWLSRNKFAFREDSTNADTSYARNWVRRVVLPLLEKRAPGVTGHIAALAHNAQCVAGIISPTINKWIDDNVVSMGSRRFAVKKKGFRNAAVAAEAMAKVLREWHIGFDHRHMDTLIENRARSGGVFLLPGGWKYRCKEETVEFFSGRGTESPGDFRIGLRVPGVTVCKPGKCRFVAETSRRRKCDRLSFSDPATAFVDSGKCGGRLEFRPVEKGERFWPFGAPGYIECNRFLKKQGLGADERAKAVVVAIKGGEILWVVGLRTSHKFRISVETKTVLKISYKTMN
jgi:tRNA(Ile)-lysidine synthase